VVLAIRCILGAGTQGIVSFISIDEPSQTLLLANFATGTVFALPIADDGTLSAPVSSVRDTGSGPNPRQDGPHPHCIVADPTGRYALVADFGADRVFIYPFDRRTRTISPSGAPAPYAVAPGSGPRRLVWHPDGRTLYLMTELTATVSTLEWDPRAGTLTERDTLAADPPTFAGTRSAAELALSRDARFLYLSNRGENTLQVYAVDPVSAIPTLVQRTSCGGSVPWSFSIDRSGRWMFVSNQDSNAVDVFSVDPGSGQVAATSATVEVPGPDGVTFA
jgi:6-phosphogluconolactonase (cycloisomerase 2 family)